MDNFRTGLFYEGTAAETEKLIRIIRISLRVLP